MDRLLAAAVVVIAVLLLGARRTAVPSTRTLWAAAAVVAVMSAVVILPILEIPPSAAVLAVVAALAYVRTVRRRRSALVAARRRDTAIAACTGLAADLRSGVTPTAALRTVAEEWDEFHPVADAGRLGADVPDSIRRLAAEPGAASLRWVAAAWAVAHRSGSGLAGAVDLAVGSMLEERATAAVLETELASARATAHLLAVLPVGVLLIGRGAGGDPFGFLLGTAAGTGCLVVGLALAWAGLRWIEAIADGIQRS
jgi:tight adherence protein B